MKTSDSTHACIYTHWKHPYTTHTLHRYTSHKNSTNTCTSDTLETHITHWKQMHVYTLQTCIHTVHTCTHHTHTANVHVHITNYKPANTCTYYTHAHTHTHTHTHTHKLQTNMSNIHATNANTHKLEYYYQSQSLLTYSTNMVINWTGYEYFPCACR